MKELELFIGCLIVAISAYIMGSILLNKSKRLSVKNIMAILCMGIILTILNTVTPTILNNILKVLMIYICYIGFYKILFDEKLLRCILASFMMYLIILASETIISILISLIMCVINITDFTIFQNTLGINISVAIIGTLITYKGREKLSNLIKKINRTEKAVVIFVALIMITLALLLFKTPISEMRIDINLVVTLFLIASFCIIGLFLIKQQSEVNEKEEEYKKLANYSQITEGVLEEYRLNLHESRNQLIIIRNMIFTTKKKELKEYVNNLIDATEVNKYRWVNELKYIPIPELKGFINFKLMEMSNKKIDIEINVERKLKSSKMKNLKIKDKGDLYNIIGVFLDNAKEASLESKEKRVAIEMYEIDNDVHIVIANTYKGKIDIEKINEYGYSSKGKNRGTGLHLVNKIIERNIMFERTTSKMDEYFVQELTVHLENIQ